LHFPPLAGAALYSLWMVARLAVAALGVVALLSSCSSEPSSQGDEDITDSTGDTTDSTEDITDSTEDITDSTEAAASNADPASEEPAIRAVVENSGESVVFSWDSVVGAESYGVLVLDGEEKLLWVWTGRATTVRYGALPEPIEEIPDDPEFVELFGPFVGETVELAPAAATPPDGAGYWIIAFDESGSVLTASQSSV